ncbi:A-kinase anchor protein 7 isoforms delta and gamma [Araneus ventricosus]|uniref:A-kinase anchor protein 7 isoforms delta and gamma n=1 Tax=Araneus ventricosus TaxID=182803 RepID=A0A4Y2R8J3_ARAVE|nr:A-kinase anchor protein 7 isoforms delta and gamma [Araneus ventricosus]
MFALLGGLNIYFLTENLPGNSRRQSPNYFVAVQISNPRIHENVKRVQRHIVRQARSLHEYMNATPTLHITLMVINVSDRDTHERALKALHNVYDECNEVMCREPLQLEFSGLGNFRDRVLYAKIRRDQQYRRLCSLAECVERHFAKVNIFSTDPRPFDPHLTIAKINFNTREQKGLEKIDRNWYASLINKHIGFQTIAGIQLLCMTSPVDDAGYYTGDSLIFKSPASSKEPQVKKEKDLSRN